MRVAPRRRSARGVIRPSVIAPLLAAAIGGGFGCGVGCAPPVSAAREPAAATATPPSGELAADAADAADGADAAPAAPRPVLGAAALAARAQAQRATLGASAPPLEDLEGKPVPWIAAAADPDATAEPGAGGDAAVDPARAAEDDLLANLPGSSGLGPAGVLPRADGGVHIDGNALGLYVPIDGADHPEGPLARFYAALRELQAGRDADGKVRVLLYGASHTDADVYPHYLRSYLQARFGDGGHGFVQLVQVWRWYRHLDATVDSASAWATEHAQRKTTRGDGLYGLLGASAYTTKKGKVASVTPDAGVLASRVEIYYLRQPGGGSFTVEIDGERRAKVKTKAKTIEPGFHAIELPEGHHRVAIRTEGNGEVRVFGVTLERDTPGVVVDTLGIPGTRAANMLKWDEALWRAHVARRAPDLIALAYGTNEATDANQPIESYEADLREVLRRVRSATPAASCLLIGPGSFPQRVTAEDGTQTWAARPRVRQIVEVQRQVARDVGCGFYDTLEFMGGDLAMVDWAAAEPKMAREDHIHLTRRGYTRFGMALTDAIMAGFDAAAASPSAGDAPVADAAGADAATPAAALPSLADSGTAAAAPGP